MNNIMSEDDMFLDIYDEAIAVLYDETFDFLNNVETVMHIIPEKKLASKEKLDEIERMIDKIKQYNQRFMEYNLQVLIK